MCPMLEHRLEPKLIGKDKYCNVEALSDYVEKIVAIMKLFLKVIKYFVKLLIKVIFRNV